MEKIQRELCGAIRASLGRRATPLGIAFSGGMDSSVLLDTMAQVFGPEQLRAIHVCHSLRPADELDAELGLVRRACFERRIPLSVVTIRRGAIAAYAEERGCGVEAAARRFRYRALLRVARQHRLSVIAMAHHQDDQIETFLMRLLRGGRLVSLSGMPAERLLEVDPEIRGVRPFLSIPRSKLEEYAKRYKLNWSEDSTNMENIYLRNRIRSVLIPLLDRHFPSWRGASDGYRAEIRALGEYVRGQARMALGTRMVQSEPDMPVSLDLTSWGAEPAALRLEMLGIYTSRLPLSRPLGRNALLQLDAAMLGKRGKIEVGGAVFARGTSSLEFEGQAPFSSSPGTRNLAMLARVSLERSYYIKIASPGVYRCGPFKLRVLDALGAQGSGGAHVAGAYAIPLSFPFVIRSARGGETIEVAPNCARSAAESIARKAGLQPELRAIVPLIEDEKGVAAVLPSACPGGERRRDAIRVPSLGEATQIVYIFLSMKGDQFINA